MVTSRTASGNGAPVVRVAAAGDLHWVPEQAGQLASRLERIEEAADLLLVAGDLTERGHLEEAAGVARELATAKVPVVAVLGNHDHHLGAENEVAAVIASHGVHLLEGEGVVMDVGDVRVGVAGVTGFGGGFPGACVADFGEAPMKDFAAAARDQADRLEAALRGLDADIRIALLHYAPCRETLRGERLELYPFLGSHLLGQAIDRAGADLVLHGHAHFGRHEGATPRGIPVRNVSLPVIRHAIRIFAFTPPSSQDPVGARRIPAAWTGPGEALSVHVYSPPLTSMTFYDDHPDRFLTPLETQVLNGAPEAEGPR